MSRTEQERGLLEAEATFPECARLAARVRELEAVAREIADAVTTDARELARKVMHENNHRVTGTEAERIGCLLQLLDRHARLARSVAGGGA